MEQILALITGYPLIVAIFTGLGTLVVLMTILVPITGTKKDDAILAKIESNTMIKSVWDFLKRFSLIAPKK